MHISYNQSQVFGPHAYLKLNSNKLAKFCSHCYTLNMSTFHKKHMYAFLHFSQQLLESVLLLLSVQVFCSIYCSSNEFILCAPLCVTLCDTSVIAAASHLLYFLCRNGFFFSTGVRSHCSYFLAFFHSSISSLF